MSYKEKLKNQILENYPYEFTLDEEHPFMHSRAWRFDLAIVKLKIAIEYDGLIFKPEQQRGGHQTPKGMINDMEKRNEAQIRGWLVLIANQVSIKDFTFIEQLERAIKVRKGDIRYE